MKFILLSAWAFRYFIFSSIRTEFRAKFVRSRLGGLWMILNPLVQVLIFAFVLSAVLAARLPGVGHKYAYTIYLMSGTLAWSLFSEIVARCVTLFVDNGNILKKLAFPKIALPIIVVGSALVNNALLFLAMLSIFGALGFWPGTAIFWLPVLTVLTVALAVGLGFALGVLNVFMRDIEQVVPVVMQIVYWFTPIVYMVNVIPEQYRDALVFNPLVAIVAAYQNVLLFDRAPDWAGLGGVLLLSLLLLVLSFELFRRAAPEMVDQL